MQSAQLHITKSTQCSCPIYYRRRAPFSFRHYRPHPPPKIAPDPPPPLPRIRIHKLKAVPEPRPLKLRNIRHIDRQSRALKSRATALVQIELVRPFQAPRRPARRRTGGQGRVGSVGDGGGYGGVASGDEVAPDGHEGLVEGGSLVRGG